MKNRNRTFTWNKETKSSTVKISGEAGGRFDIDFETIQNTSACVTAIAKYFMQAYENVHDVVYGYFGMNTYVAERFGENDWSIWCVDYRCDYSERFKEEHGPNGSSIRGTLEDCIRNVFNY